MGTIVGSISQKGGVGKSTLSRAIAREAAASGMTVKLADLDNMQGTCVNWQRRRNDLGSAEPMFSVETYQSVKKAIQGGYGFDLLILDGPARASVGTLEIAREADILVQPLGASFDDIDPAVLLFHELVQAGINSEKLVFALCRISTDTEERVMREYLGKTRYHVLEGHIPEKATYKLAMNVGRSITETQHKQLNKRADKMLQSLIARIISLS